VVRDGCGKITHKAPEREGRANLEEQRGERRWAGWMLLAAALVATAAGLIWALTVVPRWLYPPLRPAELGQVSDPGRRIELETNRLKLQNDARGNMLQGLAGLAVLGGAIVAARQLRLGREQLQHNLQSSRDQLELSRSGQLTERFTRAIDQLGTQDQLEVVLGGIYALERIARDSPGDRSTIAEILTTYVRNHVPRLLPRAGEDLADAPGDELPALQTRAPDVQAALIVLCRGGFAYPLDLHGTDLRSADLTGVNLQGVRLEGADLKGVQLDGANLQDARLGGADLRGAGLSAANLRRATLVEADLQGARLGGAVLHRARLASANLQEARLAGANLREARLDNAGLQGAQLVGADLQDARLERANLHHATLVSANLQGAILSAANLQGARLDGSDLQGATLIDADLQGAILRGANLRDARLFGVDLRGAQVDETTIWPEGFNSIIAGVVPSERSPGGGGRLRT